MHKHPTRNFEELLPSLLPLLNRKAQKARTHWCRRLFRLFYQTAIIITDRNIFNKSDATDQTKHTNVIVSEKGQLYEHKMNSSTVGGPVLFSPLEYNSVLLLLTLDTGGITQSHVNTRMYSRICYLTSDIMDS